MAMSKTLAMLAAATMCAAAMAGPGKQAKLTDVKVCPVTMEAVKGSGGGSVVHGTFRVHFCCARCKPAFAKLTKVQKDKKIREALRKVATPKQPALTEVKVCPIMMNPVHGSGGGSVVYGKYRVYFCCGGCKPAFELLTDAQKNRKIALALKKQRAN
jgi:hypothetical protein